MRILLLFLFTASSFMANKFLHVIPTVIWYFIFVNSFVFVLFFVNFLRIKSLQTPIEDKKLYYFSGIGGVFGGVLMMVLSWFYGLRKKFIIFEMVILGVWCIGLILLFNLYAPFEQIVRNLF